MRIIIGLALILAGIALGVWAGLVWALVGGIVTIVEQLRAPQIAALTLAWAIVKIVFAGLIGWVSALVLIIPGAGLIGSSR